jgi:hypothetical protein
MTEIFFCMTKNIFARLIRELLKKTLRMTRQKFAGLNNKLWLRKKRNENTFCMTKHFFFMTDFFLHDLKKQFS